MGHVAQICATSPVNDRGEVHKHVSQIYETCPEDDPTGAIHLYVVECIRAANVSTDAFVRDPDINLQAFANRAFGVFQNEEEFGKVVWRFSPRAAAHARGFVFHPSKVMEISRPGLSCPLLGVRPPRDGAEVRPVHKCGAARWGQVEAAFDERMLARLPP